MEHNSSSYNTLYEKKNGIITTTSKKLKGIISGSLSADYFVAENVQRDLQAFVDAYNAREFLTDEYKILSLGQITQTNPAENTTILINGDSVRWSYYYTKYKELCDIPGNPTESLLRIINVKPITRYPFDADFFQNDANLKKYLYLFAQLAKCEVALLNTNFKPEIKIMIEDELYMYTMSRTSFLSNYKKFCMENEKETKANILNHIYQRLGIENLGSRTKTKKNLGNK